MIGKLISNGSVCSRIKPFSGQVRLSIVRSFAERAAQQSVDIRQDHVAAKGTNEVIGLNWMPEYASEKKKGISFHANAA